MFCAVRRSQFAAGERTTPLNSQAANREKSMSVTTYIGLGSNVGERQANLDRATAALQEASQIDVTQVSSYYEYDAVGGPPGQGPYLNAVIEIQTERTPEDLLALLLNIEQRLGRVR